MFGRARSAAASLIFVILLAGPAAHADDPPDEAAPPTSNAEAERRSAEAKQRYENGMGHFNLEEWDSAIDEWKAGYRAKPVPQFLYNIAQAYRASKRYDKALGFYQKYLRMSPKAPNRNEVERHISSLQALIEQENKTQGQPPIAPIQIKTPSHEPAIASTPTPAPVVVTPVEPIKPAPVVEPTQQVVLTATPPPPVPVTKRKWFLPVVIGAAVVVVAAVVIGVAVGVSGGGDNTKTLPVASF